MLREYFNEKSAIWDENVAEKDMVKLEEMVKRLDIKAGSVVLDVGTGTGVFLPYILGRIGKKGRVIALDIAEEMLKIARSKNFDGDIDYLQADVMEIPLVDEMFDCVICYSSFPHFRDKLKALFEIKRILKVKGRLLICHSSSRAEINEIHSQIPIMKDDILPDTVNMWLLLSNAGFGEIQVEDNNDSYLATAENPG